MQYKLKYIYFISKLSDCSNKKKSQELITMQILGYFFGDKFVSNDCKKKSN